MEILDMFPDPETGELHIVTKDRTVALSGKHGGAFGPQDIVEKTVSEHGTHDQMHISIRTRYQTEQLIVISTITTNEEKKQKLYVIVESYRKRLLHMLDCLEYLWEESVRCDQEFAIKADRISLPQIRELDVKVESFLSSAKMALADVAKIFGVFFDDFNGNHNYDKNLVWAKERFGNDAFLTKVLMDNTSGDRWIAYLIEMRNRKEHPSKDYWFKMKNIGFEPTASKMIPPCWSTDAHPQLSDIRQDMEIFINNILVLSEELIAGCVMETNTFSKVFQVCYIPEEDRNLEMPMRWGIDRIQSPPMESQA